MPHDMMTKTGLRELIEHGENSGVEFKRDAIDNRALAKELVAFANLQGGRMLLGVDKDSSVPRLTRCDPHGAHGDGRAPDDHPGNAGAQRRRTRPHQEEERFIVRLWKEPRA